ncbi:MAG: hypothetical protein A2Y14_05110 [Verrucomicrobia bacterium GWF2_51_19]|nr:MAG: hypothetical protein A2Y14_05110 [Verrucomicrobia bacterium GWF2_51_19]
MFVLQQVSTLWFGVPLFEHFLTLSGANVSHGYVWTFLTYAFLHGNTWHLFLNALFVFFLGRTIEMEEGSRRFLTIYILSLLLAGLAWLAIHFDRHTLLLGASGANMGLLTYYCLTHRDRPMTLLIFFVLPVTLMPSWILWGFFGFEFFNVLFQEIPGTTDIASSAHLGGMLGGLVYYYWMRRGRAIELPAWFRKKKSSRHVNFHLNIDDR